MYIQLIVDVGKGVVNRRRRCVDSRYVLRCVDEEERLCGHGDIYMKYFCFSNILELQLESRVHPTYVSLLLSYQVLHGMTQLWLDESASYISFQQGITIIPVPLRTMDPEYLLQSYRYTIKTFYGFILQVYISAHDILENEDISVSVFDGPILVNSSFLYDMDQFTYTGGFTITCGVDMVNSKVVPEIGLKIVFQRKEQNITNINLLNTNHTYTTTINTQQKNGHFYYKYFRVNVDNHFVKLTFTNLKTFSGASYNCDYGGFVLSDFLKRHFRVNGPYCKQHGTEPLVNDITTFYSQTSHLTLLVYSYTFEMNVDLLFEATQCEGLTNICDFFCGDNNFLKIEPVNYNYKRKKRKSSYLVSIQMLKGCLKVQRTLNEGNIRCEFSITAREGTIQTLIQSQNNFR